MDYIPGVAPISVADLPPQFHGRTGTALQLTLDAAKSVPSEAKYLLLTSYYELEASAIDNLKANLPVPVYCIGPAVPHRPLQDNAAFKDVPDYFNWLNAQPESSVLDISLGSFISVSDEQMNEIAAGVIESGVRFFWVMKEDHISRLQKGMNNNRGLIVPWCDQIRVLRHGSIGGFWSHCGWNSSKEGALAGVPMLTFPLIWDQYPNSKHIVEDWKMGRRLKKSDGVLVSREEISGALKMFMDLDWEEGKEMRRRAENVREICCRAIGEGGSAELQIQAFLKEITSQIN